MNDTKITLVLTPQEAQVLAGVFDLVLKAHGMRVAKETLHLMSKLEEATQPQEAPATES